MLLNAMQKGLHRLALGGGVLLLGFAATVAATGAAGAKDGEWITAEGTDCRLWNRFPEEELTVSWTGACAGGKAEGFGRVEWRFANRHADTCHCEYQNGIASGYGEYRWADGGTYHGEFKDGSFHGVGRLTYPDRERYEGEFKDGERHGHGVLLLPDMTEVVGRWENDVLVERVAP